MAHLALSLLGAPRIALDDTPVTSLESDKVRALLMFLAVEADRPHRREALAGLLWPDQPERAARHSLSQALFNLRQALADHAADPPFLLITREALQFNRASDHWLDTAEFERLIIGSESHAHRRRSTCARCARQLAEAVDVYCGELLTNFSLTDSTAFDEWVLIKRERLRQLALDALGDLIEYHERRGDHESTRRYALRQLEIDPWREATYRRLMRLLMLGGQRNAALALYERCRQVLADDLGVEPEDETTALYASIREQADALPDSAHQLTAASQQRHHLPAQTTPFVGREQELATIARLLADPDCRLITVVGPGGIGKTRLALQTATEHLDSFADGVFFVPLAPLPESDLLVSAIADALRLNLRRSEDPRRQLLEYLRTREALLVLDNFEHLLAGADLVADILRDAPGVTILVTSRERLHLRSEWLLAVGGLPVPALESRGVDEPSGAVELFVQSARRVRPDFAPPFASAQDIARICRLVDGMPLAIELAAAWTRVLSCAEIADEIERSLAFLNTSLRDVPERHHSLGAVFEHSWNLLRADEQRVLRRLTVFQGGFQRDAAEQVAEASLAHLAALLDKSLLRHNPAGRYDMHESIRQYAGEKLREAGELDATQRRHLAFFLQSAETLEPRLKGPEQQTAVDLLEREHDNLRAALSRALESGLTEQAARLGGALWHFWWLHGHFVEGARWLDRALAHDGLPPQIRAKALHGLGVLLQEQGRYHDARSRYTESLAIRRAEGDTRGVAASLNSLGVVAFDLGDYDAARAMYEESLALKRWLGDTRGIAGTLNNLGMIASAQGDFERARSLYNESLILLRAAGNKTGIAVVLGNLGAIALDQGDPAARALFAESLRLFQELGERDGVAECLEGLAGVAATEQRFSRAARLYGAAAALRETLGAPLIAVEQQRAERMLSLVRAGLGEAALNATLAEGRAMEREAAIRYALGDIDLGESPTR